MSFTDSGDLRFGPIQILIFQNLVICIDLFRAMNPWSFLFGDDMLQEVLTRFGGRLLDLMKQSQRKKLHPKTGTKMGRMEGQGNDLQILRQTGRKARIMRNGSR